VGRRHNTRSATARRVKTLLDERGNSLQFSASLGVGLVLGILNWALWSGWTKRLLKQKTMNWGFFFVVSFLKLGLLGAAIWFLLSKEIIEPMGFLVGFSIVVVMTIVKGLKWDP